MTDGHKAEEDEREVRPGSELAPSRLSSTLDPSNGDHPKLTTDDTDHDDLKKTCKGLFSARCLLRSLCDIYHITLCV